MELGDSAWERSDFSRLLEQLLDSPGAPPHVLKYLGGCLAPTGLGEGGGAMSTTFGSKLQPDASVTAVLLIIKFDEEGFECSASQVHDAAALGDPDLVHVLLDAGVDIKKPDGRTGRSPLHTANTHGLASTVAAVKQLLDLGADSLLKDKHVSRAVRMARLTYTSLLSLPPFSPVFHFGATRS
jgi:hypothetical protein